MTIWCDRSGQIQQCMRRTLDYACEDFRMCKREAVHAELLKFEGERDTTLLEWERR